MSMNLHCESDKIKVELTQTPTQITNMCVVQPDGTLLVELTGKKAKHALRIYIEWVAGSLNGLYQTEKEIDEYNERSFSLNKHIHEINKVINSKKKLEVYVL